MRGLHYFIAAGVAICAALVSVACQQSTGQPQIALINDETVAIEGALMAVEETITDGDNQPLPPTGETLELAPNLAEDCPATVVTPLYTRYSFRPTDADPATISPEEPKDPCQMVYVPRIPRHRLLVFLPGTGGSPAAYTRFMSVAAVHGYDVIGLAYDNYFKRDTCSACPAVTAGTLDEATCSDGVKDEQLLGTDSSPCVDVPAANGLVHRLTAALEYLAQEVPGGGFDQYLESSSPKWSEIAFAGHSQGAAVTVNVAQRFPLARVLMFSGPIERLSSTGLPPPYISKSAATQPFDRYFGFAHHHDASNIDPILANWKILAGAGWPLTGSIDNATPPYAFAHGLTSAVIPPSLTPFNGHNDIVANSVPNLPNSNNAYYKTVWHYMLDGGGDCSFANGLGLPIQPVMAGTACTATQEADYEYTQTPVSQYLTLYKPSSLLGVRGPLATVIWIHGGRWEAGTRAGGGQALFLACHDYAVASIDYRLSDPDAQNVPLNPHPAQIHDVKAAIRYLRANADTLGIDPDRFAVFGSSAGGHLAALAALTQDGELEDLTQGNANVSSAVQAGIDWYGPAELAGMDADAALQACTTALPHDTPDSPESHLLGCQTSDPACAPQVSSASPVSYVDASNAPLLIMHGSEDCTVPVRQSEKLFNALRNGGSCTRYRPVLGAGHGGSEWATAEVQKEVLGFLKATLH